MMYLEITGEEKVEEEMKGKEMIEMTEIEKKENIIEEEKKEMIEMKIMIKEIIKKKSERQKKEIRKYQNRILKSLNGISFLID